MALPNMFFEHIYSDQFPKWNRGDCPAINYVAENEIECNIQKNESVMKKKQLIITDQYIINISKKNSVKWLSIENTTFKFLSNSKEPFQTFIFQQGENILKIEGNLTAYVKNIKRFVIQQDFKHRYQFQKKLGQGAFADVYQIREKGTENYFAVKMFDKSNLENSENNKKALLKEIQILRVLNSYSTINLIECFESPNFLYIVMEQLKGGNLNEYFEKNAPLSEKTTSKIIYSLLQTIKYINSCGIIHRDLKPENIIFRERNNIDTLCIADFGLADFYNQEGKYLFTRCGSVGFVAPEILRDKIYDFKVDLFSIGVIMYCAIAKKQPFEGNSLLKVQKNFIGEIDFSIINLSENGLQFLRDILKPNPQYRLDVRESLTHSWFIDQNIINLKGTILKNRSSFLSNNNTPIKSESPFSTPKSPSSVRTTIKQSPFLQQLAGKRMSNFKLEKIEHDQSPRILDQAIKSTKATNKHMVRKSIFKYLDPIKKSTDAQ